MDDGTVDASRARLSTACPWKLAVHRTANSACTRDLLARAALDSFTGKAEAPLRPRHLGARLIRPIPSREFGCIGREGAAHAPKFGKVFAVVQTSPYS